MGVPVSKTGNVYVAASMAPHVLRSVLISSAVMPLIRSSTFWHLLVLATAAAMLATGLRTANGCRLGGGGGGFDRAGGGGGGGGSGGSFEGACSGCGGGCDGWVWTAAAGALAPRGRNVLRSDRSINVGHAVVFSCAYLGGKSTFLRVLLRSVLVAAAWGTCGAGCTSNRFSGGTVPGASFVRNHGTTWGDAGVCSAGGVHSAHAERHAIMSRHCATFRFCVILFEHKSTFIGTAPLFVCGNGLA